MDSLVLNQPKRIFQWQLIHSEVLINLSCVSFVYWAVYYTSPQRFVFLFVGLIDLDTIIEF